MEMLNRLILNKVKGYSFPLPIVNSCCSVKKSVNGNLVERAMFFINVLIQNIVLIINTPPPPKQKGKRNGWDFQVI